VLQYINITALTERWTEGERWGVGEKELEKHTLNRFTSDLWMIITVHRERLREREEEGDAMM
jgi:hypothetical protein